MSGPGTPGAACCPACSNRVLTRRNHDAGRRVIAHYQNGIRCAGSGQQAARARRPGRPPTATPTGART